MKLSEKSETWMSGDSSAFFEVVERGGRIQWYHNTGTGNVASDWPSAIEAASKRYTQLHPAGRIASLVGRRWRWEQHMVGESRSLTLNFAPNSTTKVGWYAVLKRFDRNLSEHYNSEVQRGGAVATWEEGIERGRAALDAMAAVVPFKYGAL